MSKKSKINIEEQLASRIPYVKCYEDEGIIETIPGVFTVGYVIEKPKGTLSIQYNPELVRSCFVSIIKNVALLNMSCQFCIRNRSIDEEEYLNEVLLSNIGEKKLDIYVDAYNQTIKDNTSIGHNNYETITYFILSTVEKDVELAIEKFRDAREVFEKEFDCLYAHRLHQMSLEDRLKSLFDIYHPENKEVFGDVVDFDGKGFSIDSMQKMKMTTKDIIAPNTYDFSNRDYMIVGTKYVRALFINSIPKTVQGSVLMDIMRISSNSILSVCYEPIDSNIGFNAAAKAVKRNTNPVTVQLRESLEDRKLKRTKVEELPIEENEQTYFEQAALELFKDAVAKDNPTLLSSLVIILFADSLEELNRDTKLLKLSADKYAVCVKSADMMQDKAFQSALPLNNMKIDIKRAFSLERVSCMPPIDVQSLFEQIRTFHGLNAINDNLVLLDRRNGLIGMIAGIEHSGKTFACKREALNALISSNDEVIILSKNSNDYKHFVNELGGEIVTNFHPDFMQTDINYNLTDPADDLKKAFLDALIIQGNNIHKKKYKVLHGNTDEFDEHKLSIEKAEAEAEQLKDCNSFYEMVAKINANRVTFELSYQVIDDYILMGELGNQRLHVIQTSSERDLIIYLNYFWNYVVEQKKKNKNVWLFIDGADDFMYSTAGSDFLISILDRMEKMNTSVTVVIDDAVHIVTNQDAAIEYEYLLKKVSYFKLLCQGPLERRFYIEKLNIPDSLIPYISDSEPGEGIIITTSANTAFNDRFETEEHPFYSLFY